jgi:hypothetical protein
MSARSSTAIPEGRAESEEAAGAEPDEPGQVKPWALLAVARLRGLSQELAETAEVSPELKRSGRARRAARGGESARQKIR